MRRRILQGYADFKHLTLGVPRLKVRPTDCFVTSWPRSGNTWMRYLLFYAMYPDDQWDLVSIEERMPIVDRLNFRRKLPALESEPVRMFKSHELFRPYYLTGKTVYVVRDGRDATVSFYHYRSKLRRRPIEWRRFLEQTLAGRNRYGSWHGHVGGWLAHEDHPSMLIVRYEDMLADPPRELRRALRHLGLEADDDRVAKAVERSSVDEVNKGFQKYAAGKSRPFSGGLGGGSGRHKAQFSEEDEALFMEHAGELMRRLGYVQ